MKTGAHVRGHDGGVRTRSCTRLRRGCARGGVRVHAHDGGVRTRTHPRIHRGYGCVHGHDDVRVRIRTRMPLFLPVGCWPALSYRIPPQSYFHIETLKRTN